MVRPSVRFRAFAWHRLILYVGHGLVTLMPTVRFLSRLVLQYAIVLQVVVLKRGRVTCVVKTGASIVPKI